MKSKTILAAAIIASLLIADCEAKTKTLKEAFQNDFLIGVAMNTPQIIGTSYADNELITKQFNSIVAENCMKSEVIHPEQYRYDFSLADSFVNFGMKHKMAIIGHALIWHSQLSKWFCFDSEGNKVSRDTLIGRMKEHICTIMKRYKGKIKGWDVVNEAFEDNGSFRNNLFYQIIGKDYIDLAFQFAHEADPDAELYLNDFSMFKPAKCDAAISEIKHLRSKGLRVDAMGMQFHYLLDDPKTADVETSIKKLADAGIKINITEFDLSVLPLPKGNAGADVNKKLVYDKSLNPYADGILPKKINKKWNKEMLELFSILLKYKDYVDRVTMWGLNDKENWKNNWPIPGRTDYPLLFDRNNKPKPIVNKIINLSTK